MLKVTASLLFLCPWPTVVTVPSAGSSEQPPNPEFTSQAVVCLIGAVGRRWGLYGPRERAQLFQGVQRELEDHGYVLPVERIRRKWNNLIVTYKRVKDRSCGTGKAKTSWEYFELMDAMLGDTVGAKSSGTPSASMVATVTPASPPQSTAPHPSSTAPGYADPQAPSPSRGSPPDRHDRLRARRKPRQGPADVAASFLLQQQRQAEDCSTMLCDFLAGQEDRARLQEMRLVRHESRERRRERREGKMADALCRIATALELLSSKQDTVIALLQRLADKQRNSFQIWKKIWKESLRFSLRTLLFPRSTGSRGGMEDHAFGENWRRQKLLCKHHPWEGGIQV
ncbi:uncharacterized protein LOC108928850 isoform X3 [Scleropages formosus]|uniref:uncharacterized protein LOC108928850 isoform X3 n=1 Tax=Scleropages formosus TaxID=113540 RepID=UPI0010FA662D|nr:uncharacterized protein LOC108928850 isoform X3 [Scleropages formosus]